MTTTFAENDNRDLFVGDNNSLSLISGVQATSQGAKSAVEVQRGEVVFDTEKGVPTSEAIWEGTPNLQQLEFFIRQQILDRDDVTEVSDFAASVVGDSVEYSAVIEDDEQETDTINGII